MTNSRSKSTKANARAGRGGAAIGVGAEATAAVPQPTRRAQRAAERRQAIVDAALVEFSASGFAAARLDDIAARAGVGKGTIYLYFADKEALFQELIRTSIVPIVGRLGSPPAEGTPARVVVERFMETFLKEVYATPRADIIRLMIAEGARFPSLAEFYYREVVARGIAGMQMLLNYAVARGEISNPAVAKHPQLLVAPALVAVIWHGLFGKFAPLDLRAMFKVHIDLLFGPGRAP